MTIAVMSGQDPRELWEPLDAVSQRYQIEYGMFALKPISLMSCADNLAATLRDTTTGLPLPHGVKPSIMTSNQKRINLIPAHYLPEACMRYDAPSVVKICEVCASGHETRRCSGSTLLTFRMCPVHESQHITDADLQVLGDVRNFWKRKYDAGPLGWKLIRQLPPVVQYVHADGCMYGHAPDVVVGSVDEGVVGGLWWRDCTGVKVNARGQVLASKPDEGWSLAGLRESELAGRCRWEMRKDLVLEGLGEGVFVGRMWDLNRKRRK